MNGQRILSGPAALKASDRIRKQHNNQEDWPYEWLFPPKYARRIRPHGTLAVSAMTAGTQAVVLAYTVPTGFVLVLTHLFRTICNPSGFVEGTGTATWVLDINRPLGVTSIQGYPVQGFEQDVVTLGSVAGQPLYPWPLIQPEILQSLDLLQEKVTITSDISDGVFYSCFVGYLVPNTRT